MRAQNPRTNLYLWADCGIFAGADNASKLHGHHAIQITYMLEGESRIQAESDSGWRYGSGYVVLPGTMYRAATPGPYLTFFIDVNHPLYWRHKLAEKQKYPNGVRALEPPTKSMLDAISMLHQGGVPCDKASDMLCNQVDTEFPEKTAKNYLDSRVVSIVQYIDEKLPGMMKMKEICEVVHLSESRTMHLFRSETGTTVRQFILWRRLKLALLTISQGCSITEAAHVASFSDAAHLTRTFVTMFGFSPTEILAGPVKAKFILCR